jgi:hypothetical protein
MVEHIMLTNYNFKGAWSMQWRLIRNWLLRVILPIWVVVMVIATLFMFSRASLDLQRPATEQLPVHVLEKSTNVEPIVEQRNQSLNKTVSAEPRPLPTCANKHTSVAFVKTHKCAGDLLATIFLRFADENNLEVLLPRAPSTNIRYPSQLRVDAHAYRPSSRPDKRFQMQMLHTVYDHDTWHALLARDAAYIGVVRHPLRQFQSYFNYYYVAESLQAAYNVSLEGAVDYFLANHRRLMQKDAPWKNMFIRRDALRNTMMYDFGATFHPEQDSSRYIQGIVSNFSLVMLADSLDESLLLMKRQFCWDLSDILYVSKNIAGTGAKAYKFDTTNTTLTEQRERLHREMSPLDYDLYSNASSVFWHKMEVQTDFYQELDLFRQTNQRVTSFCQSARAGETSVETLTISGSPYNQMFTVDQQFCQRIKRGIMPYINSFYTS